MRVSPAVPADLHTHLFKSGAAVSFGDADVYLTASEGIGNLALLAGVDEEFLNPHLASLLVGKSLVGKLGLGIGIGYAVRKFSGIKK